MRKIIYAFKSLFQILRPKKERVDPRVLFYYPQHFNRGKDGTNDFFKPFLDCCKKYNISYVLFEEPSETNARRNKNAIPFDFVFYFIVLLRKLLPLRKYRHFEEREWQIGRILKSFFFRAIKPEIVITMSNSMLGFFRGWGDTLPLYDYQHGIIYSWHNGYIGDNKPAQHILNNRSKLMLFGNGFKKLLTKEEDSYFLDNSVIIGIDIHYQLLHKQFNKSILLTLPIATAHEITELQIEQVQKLKALFQTHQSFYEENQILFYLRHHPRYDGSFDFSSILSFPFVRIINKPLGECFVDCSVHLTFNSTTVFDAAVLGIPTLFLGDVEDNSLYEKEFEFPDFRPCSEIQKNIEEFLINAASYRAFGLVAQNWVKEYYQAFNEDEFLKIINEKN